MKYFIALLLLLLASPSFADTFSVVVFGDTHESGTAPNLIARNDWVVAQKEALDIEYVLHLGDGTSTVADQPIIATAMKILNDEVPFLFTIGNHEIDSLNRDTADRTFVAFDAAFPVSDFPWIDGNFAGMQNSYDTITVAGVDYLFLSVGYCPDDDSIAWADGILSANRDKKVIISLHYYFETWGTENLRATDLDAYGGACFNNGSGDDLYNNVFKNYPNILMIVSGHGWDATVPASTGFGDGKIFGAIKRVDSVNRNAVNQLRQNWQTAYGSNSFLRIYTIDTETDVIQAETYSPVEDVYLTENFDTFYLNNSSVTLEGVSCGGITIN